MISKTFNILASIVCISFILTIFAGVSYAEDIKTIHAYSGDLVEFSGQAMPNTNVTIGVTRTITVGVTDGRFSTSLEGLLVPKGSILSLTASPVTILKVNGIVHDSTFSSIYEADISGDTGTLSMNDIPDGDYDITIYGTSGANEVSLTIVASQNFTSNSSGYYSANASSKGLPPGVYNITANGAHIADVYLEQRNIPTWTISTVPRSNPFENEWLIGALIIITVAALAFVAFDAFFRKRKK